MRGRVLDMVTQAPVLAYVWLGDEAIAMTNDRGEWEAVLAAPAHLRFTAVGYDGMEGNVPDGGTVYLIPSVSELDPVVVTPTPRPVPVEAGLPWWAWAGFLALVALSSPRRR